MKGYLALIVLLVLISTPALAQLQMPSGVVSGGGSEMQGSNTIRGTLAQSIVGPVAGPSYRLKVGFWHEYLQQISASDDVPAYIWDLQSAYPNPFNPQTTISYSLPDRSHVRLCVYDLRGALVATLVDDSIEAGNHTSIWNGRADSGSGVASGVYFARINSRHGILTQKMVLTR